MKEFIDKLIERLEEIKAKAKPWDFGGVCLAIEIVNELAEEYKGGWIPCSVQEEPTENGKYIVCVQHFENKDLYNTEYVYWLGEWKVSYDWNVIAWMPIEPYTEGE